MTMRALYRNPIYRAFPGAAVRRLISSIYHPVKGSPFATTLLWGDRLTSIYDGYMGPSFWRYGVYDLPVCEVVARILRHSDHAIDVGANVGAVTLLMGRAVGPSGSVESIEPHPAVFDMLSRNIAHSQFAGSIVPRHCAMSNKEGTSQLVVPPGFRENIGLSSLEACGGGHSLDVRTCTLDALYRAATRIDLIKVDVEGHEHSVFMGARALLGRGVIRCIVYEDLDYDRSPVTPLLRSYGYHIFAVNETKRLVEAPLCAPHDNPTGCNFVALRDIHDAEAIRQPKRLLIGSLANRWSAFAFWPGRVPRECKSIENAGRRV